MAVAKMGAIVTEIAGSIGGLNFRRHRGTTVLSNKSNGGNKSKLKNNKALFLLREINNVWLGFKDSDRQAWDDEALLYQFPDKFGTLRNLTGKQFFTKLATPLLMIDLPPPDLLDLDSLMPAFNVVSIDYEADVECRLVVNGITESVLYFIQVERVSRFSNAPVFNRRKKVVASRTAINLNIDILQEVENYIGESKAGDLVRFYITTGNTFGFTSVPEVFDIKVS